MAEQYERMPEWFWHPKRGLYGHEEPARPGDRLLYVRVDDGAAAGTASEDDGPSQTVERFRKALMRRHHDDWDMETVAEAAHICAEELWPR